MSATDFYLKQLAPLLDATVTRLVRSGVDESGEEELFGLQLRCKDGMVRTLILLSDDEGNGPGSFMIYEE